MSDLAISSAAALTASTLSKSDLVPVLDVSASAGSKGSKITIAELSAAVRGVFDVRDYGALGDSRKVTDGAITNGDNTVTSATASFTAADVGKEIWGLVANSTVMALTTIASVNSATSIEVTDAPSQTWSNVTLIFGTDDTAALQAAHAAAKALTPRGTVYIPRGGYIFSELLFDCNESAVAQGVNVIGEGSSKVNFFIAPDYDFGSTTSNTGAFWRANGNCRDTMLQGMTIDGGTLTLSGSGYHVLSDSGDRTRIYDVRVTEIRGFTAGANLAGTFFDAENFYVYGMSYLGMNCSGGGYEFRHCQTSNCAYFGLNITSVTGGSNDGSYFRWIGGMVDECADHACRVDSSVDVQFIGARMFGFDGKYALKVANASEVRVTGCEVLSYSTSGNRGGMQVDSGCTAWVSNTRFYGAGTLYAIDNAGTVNDGGNNESGGTGTNNTGTIAVPAL